MSLDFIAIEIDIDKTLLRLAIPSLAGTKVLLQSKT